MTKHNVQIKLHSNQQELNIDHTMEEPRSQRKTVSEGNSLPQKGIVLELSLKALINKPHRGFRAGVGHEQI